MKCYNYCANGIYWAPFCFQSLIFSCKGISSVGIYTGDMGFIRDLHVLRDLCLFCALHPTLTFLLPMESIATGTYKSPSWGQENIPDPKGGHGVSYLRQSTSTKILHQNALKGPTVKSCTTPWKDTKLWRNGQNHICFCDLNSPPCLTQFWSHAHKNQTALLRSMKLCQCKVVSRWHKTSETLHTHPVSASSPAEAV